MGRLVWGKFNAAGRRHDGRATRRSVALLAGVAATALLTPAAGAQEADPQQFSGVITQLDRITIVSRTGETPIETLASVSRVDQEQIERRMATTPADIFFGVPGVTAQSDAKRAASSVNIRGLQDFGRVAVIVDGARQNFHRSGHGTGSTFWIDPELVKQVDVIRGPVANTYGSGAIGGVVFFETKDAEDFLRPDETYAVSTTGRYETNGQGWTTSSTGAFRFNDNVSVLGNIVYRDYDEYEDGDGDTVPGTGFDVLSGLAKATIRPSENSELKLGWVGADESWTELNSRTLAPSHDIDLKQNTFTARYNVTDDASSWLDLHINASYNKADLDRTYLNDTIEFGPTGRPTVNIPAGATSTYGLDTWGVDIWNTSRFDTGALGHELTYGGDWVSDDVVTARAGGVGMDVYTPSGTRRVSGVYIQDKISWDWLEVIGGLRYDSYGLDSDVAETSGDRLSPRLTVGVSPFTDEAWQGLQFYGTYAEGYRSPSITETLMSGMHPSGVTFPFLPNPNLRPETAKTWEFGVNYSRDGVFRPGDALRLKAAYFHNDIDDYIASADLSAFDRTSGCPFIPGLPMPTRQNPTGYLPICSQYQNYANARIEGVELEGVYDATWGYLGLSASFIDGHTVSYAGVREDLATVPSAQVTGQVGLRFLENRLLLGGEVQYNEAPDGNAFADNYTLVNLFARYSVNDNFKVDFRVDNLFDVKYANALNASVSPVFEPGLSVKFAATMRFGG